MAKAKNGDTVKVHYTGKLNDDSIFDSSDGRDPLQFTLGSGQVIPGFDEGVTDMEPGETKTINIPMDRAYGPVNEAMIKTVERSRLPEDLEPETGMMLQLQQPDGQMVAVTIIEVTETKITLDANHSLAGKDLIFELTLVEIA